MFLSFKPIKRASIACVALGSIAISGNALAGGTAPGQAVDNIASVNYSVGGVAQTVIRSSPTGNSTPGAGGGANTSFVVDHKVDLYVQEVSGSATTGVAPGATNQATMFFIRNDGNDAQGVTFTAANFAAAVFGNSPDFAMTGWTAYVESTAPQTGAACSSATPPGGMQFDLGTDSALNISSLAVDACTWVYIVADAPVTAQNNEYSNVELTATARVPATLAALTEDTGADRPDQVDVVFADALATVAAQDQYQIATASFTVTKASTVVDDGISTSNPKAIPGATMEYRITLANNGSATADTVSITDALPTLTTYVDDAYNGGGDNVRITVGASDTFCNAEAGGADTNADGCYRTVSAGVTTLRVESPAVPAVPAAGAVEVRFQVTIN
jgi:uncharacterized repeat protein (TIGR01451 family)